MFNIYLLGCLSMCVFVSSRVYIYHKKAIFCIIFIVIQSLKFCCMVIFYLARDISVALYLVLFLRFLCF